MLRIIINVFGSDGGPTTPNCTRLLHDMAVEQEFMHANDTLH
jgi:hypothetical protein